MPVLPLPKLHDKAPFVVLSDWVRWCGSEHIDEIWGC
jgi:hypothetical protein